MKAVRNSASGLASEAPDQKKKNLKDKERLRGPFQLKPLLHGIDIRQQRTFSLNSKPNLIFSSYFPSLKTRV